MEKIEDKDFSLKLEEKYYTMVEVTPVLRRTQLHKTHKTVKYVTNLLVGKDFFS